MSRVKVSELKELCADLFEQVFHDDMAFAAIREIYPDQMEAYDRTLGVVNMHEDYIERMKALGVKTDKWAD